MKKRLQIVSMVLLLCLALSATSFAQIKSVSGTVTDAADGSPIIGASVLIKGTTVGLITDFDGKYSITIPAGTATPTLVVSFIGYETMEITLSTSNVVNVSLKIAATEISETIIIGYGTQKKSDKTGAVTNVTAAELNTGVITDAIQSLQGKASGVTITKKGGDPSAGFSVRIRGASAFGSGTEPLYVVDGVPGVDPTTIAPEDIEAFNILKDASSSAIYGARGANGVIIITTKKGKQQKGSTFEFSNYVSLDKVAKRLDLLTADEVRKYVADNNIDFTDGGADTDWQDEIYKTGVSQSYNLSVSGAGETSTYYASINHSIFDGVVTGTGKDRTTGRINLTQKAMNEKLVITTGLSGTVEQNQYINYDGWGLHDVLYQAFRRSPTDPVTNEDGTYQESDRMFNSKNPIATLNEITNDRSAKRFNGNLKTDLTIIEGLVWGTNFSYIRNDDESFYFLPPTSYKSGEGRSSRGYNNYANKLAESTINYTKEFDVHNINLVGGYSFQEESWDGFNAGGSKTASLYVGPNSLGLLQNVKPGDVTSYKSSARLISFFARGVYNFNSKYFFTATVRADGSSKFGDNNEWGIFPSASLGWNMKDEAFLSNVSMVSAMKLRLGYGMSGNQDIGLYRDRTIMRASGTAINPETGDVVISFEGDKNANPDLKWEENHELNIGLDFGLFNSRISGTLEFYNKTVKDLLAEYQVGPPTFKYNRIFANEGEITNTGVELDIHAFAVDRTNFDWKTSLTFSTNNQNVKSLDGGKYAIDQIKVGYISGPGLVGGENWSQVVKEGYELGTFFIPEYAKLSPEGKFWFYTAAGGVTDEVAEAERRAVGSAQPDFELGWSNQISFMNGFEFNFALRSLIGFDVLNVTRMIFGNTQGLMPNGNVLQSALDEKERGLTSNPTLSSYYIENGTFVRIDNVTLAYNFNKVNMKNIKGLRVYVTSNNLYTFTGYTGIDPEIAFTGLSFGIDQYNVYPKTRTLTFGLNVSF